MNLDSPFSPHQRESLCGSLQAMQANRIRLCKRQTRLFPCNLSTAIFVHLLEDPVIGLPRILGYRAVDAAGEVIDSATWTVVEEAEQWSVWQTFSERFLAIWKKSIGKGRGPCLFFFSGKVGQGLRAWGELFGEANRLSFLWDTGRLLHLDLRRLLAEHFDLPVPGRLTLFAMGAILGCLSPPEAARGPFSRLRQPESLCHDDPEPTGVPEAWRESGEGRAEAVRQVQTLLGLEVEIWQWAKSHLESSFEQTDWQERPKSTESTWSTESTESHETIGASYLRFLEAEKQGREEDIRALQEYGLPERLARFRALGPLTFQETSLDDEGRFLYTFRLPPASPASKFREDDFLKLAPVGSRDLQDGFPVILARYRPGEDQLAVLARQGRLALSKRLTYSLEEDLTDWNHSKLVQVVSTVFGSREDHRLARLLVGNQPSERARKRLVWIEQWLATFKPVAALNPAQRSALKLPFRQRLALIEGPPGTGKTYLLGWIIIALILEAHQAGEPLRLVVSALTHRAIDGVLRKVAELIRLHRIRDFPACILKWGRWKEEGQAGCAKGETGGLADLGVQPLNDPGEIERSRYLVLGSTGFGLNHLLAGDQGRFPAIFDWVVFDEASQILVPQALLSLVYGKGRYLFLGDVKQLPPVVMARPAEQGRTRTTSLAASAWNGLPVATKVAQFGAPAGQSILAQLQACYGTDCRVRLDETYRLNQELCEFPSRMWYDGALHPAPGNAQARLSLLTPAEPWQEEGDQLLDRILAPEQPVTLVLAEHRGCHQKSELEAEIMAQLAACLLQRYGLSPDRLALISPHRAQNNAIAGQLRHLLGEAEPNLPVIDTVERLQGAERDVILFALTTSDPDQVLSEFLNNPNRFNVAITRARQKLIVVGSRAFFLAIPQNDEALAANRCFKEFLQFCQRRGSLFVWDRY